MSELRTFLGMVNHLNKFVPRLSDKTKPLRDLLSTKNLWCWESPQETAFQEVKRELCSSQVLACYNPKREILVSSDAS